MCFIHDYEWLAQVIERSTFLTEKELRCDECGRAIPFGSTMHHLYQQEHEECTDCENGYCSCKGDCCQCDAPNYGETFEWDCCEDCWCFLDAVLIAEVEAGCGPDEALPSLGNMMEDIRDWGRDEAKKYLQVAKREYPELAKSGYLGWLWRRMFC